MKTLLKVKEEEQDKDVWDLFKKVMEGYSDSVIPLLSDLQTENNNNNNINDDKSQIRNNQLQQSSVVACSSRKKAKTEASSSSTEKERRDMMTKQFSALQSMLPDTPIKAPRNQIVEETIDYIKELEEKIKGLEAKKKAAMDFSSAKPTTSIIPIYKPHHQNSVVNVLVSGNVAFFGIQTEVHQRFLFSRVLKVFEKFKTEILTATITSIEQMKITVSVTALVNNIEEGGRRADVDAIKRDLIRLFDLKI